MKNILKRVKTLFTPNKVNKTLNNPETKIDILRKISGNINPYHNKSIVYIYFGLRHVPYIDKLLNPDPNYQQLKIKLHIWIYQLTGKHFNLKSIPDKTISFLLNTLERDEKFSYKLSKELKKYKNENYNSFLRGLEIKGEQIYSLQLTYVNSWDLDEYARSIINRRINSLSSECYDYYLELMERVGPLLVKTYPKKCLNWGKANAGNLVFDLYYLIYDLIDNDLECNNYNIVIEQCRSILRKQTNPAKRYQLEILKNWAIEESNRNFPINKQNLETFLKKPQLDIVRLVMKYTHALSKWKNKYSSEKWFKELEDIAIGRKRKLPKDSNTIILQKQTTLLTDKQILESDSNVILNNFAGFVSKSESGITGIISKLIDKSETITSNYEYYCKNLARVIERIYFSNLTPLKLSYYKDYFKKNSLEYNLREEIVQYLYFPLSTTLIKYQDRLTYTPDYKINIDIDKLSRIPMFLDGIINYEILDAEPRELRKLKNLIRSKTFLHNEEAWEIYFINLKDFYIKIKKDTVELTTPPIHFYKDSYVPIIISRINKKKALFLEIKDPNELIRICNTENKNSLFLYNCQDYYFLIKILEFFLATFLSETPFPFSKLDILNVLINNKKDSYKIKKEVPITNLDFNPFKLFNNV